MSQLNILHNYKSKNFDVRKHKIQFIILHYTETENFDDALRILTSKEKKVSCHFLIDTNGQIYNLVCEKKRAWHAGISSWKGLKDLNSRSIGIEIVNPGEIQLKKYPKIQIDQLIDLILSLKKKFEIPSYNILGHSDIAPMRKIDPGRHFPWEKLYKQKIGMKVKETGEIGKSLTSNDYKIFLKNIEKIGYSGLVHNTSSSKNNKIIDAFHRHFIPNLIGKKPTEASLSKSTELLILKNS